MRAFASYSLPLFLFFFFTSDDVGQGRRGANPVSPDLMRVPNTCLESTMGSSFPASLLTSDKMKEDSTDRALSSPLLEIGFVPLKTGYYIESPFTTNHQHGEPN
jgi:hypothetical protein